MPTSSCEIAGLLLLALAGCSAKATPPQLAGSTHLFVWAWDVDKSSDDFLAVVDVDRSSATYGQVGVESCTAHSVAATRATITVNGTLNSNGTFAQPVTFTAANGTDRFGGFVFAAAQPSVGRALAELLRAVSGSGRAHVPLARGKSNRICATFLW